MTLLDITDERFRNMWTFLIKSNYDELGDIAADMKCTICMKILINAHSSTSCGCKYCLGCVQAYLSGRRRFCPGNMDECNIEALDIARNIVVDHAINYRISKLLMGFDYAGERHCGSAGAGQLDKVCESALANCPYVGGDCSEPPSIGDIVDSQFAGEHDADATLLMACTDGLQEIAFIRKEVYELRAEMAAIRSAGQENSSMRAEMERLQAEYRSLMSVTEQQSAELRALVVTQARHIDLLSDKLGELEWQGRKEKEELRRNIDAIRHEQASGHDELEKRVREMGANVVEMQNRGQFEWRVDGWAAKSQSAREGACREIFSDTFYSHENGYKMCLCVCPDGVGAVKGSHLSVYFHLMRGKSDGLLPWPFKCEVTVSLIDQRTDNEYISCTRKFEDAPNNVNWNKPVTDRNGGIGFPKLVELAALSNVAGLCQNDKIFIRCIVKSITKQ